VVKDGCLDRILRLGTIKFKLLLYFFILPIQYINMNINMNTIKKSLTHKNIKKNNISSNQKIINILTTVKDYYNSINDRFHIKAYERAIYQIKKWSKPITHGIDLKDLEGIGKGMIDKIDTILKTNTLPIIHEKKLQIINITKKDLLTLKNVLGFGDKFVSRLKNDYNIETIQELNDYLKSGKTIPLTQQQKIGLTYHNELSIPIPRLETQILYNSLIDESSIQNLIQNYKLHIKLAGSFPSGKLESKDIDILIATPRYSDISTGKLMSKIIKAIKSSKFCLKLNPLDHGVETSSGLIELSSGTTKFLGLILSRNPNIQQCIYRHLDIRIVDYKSYPYARFYYCSGKIFNIMIRDKLKKKGYKLNEWELEPNEINIKYKKPTNLDTYADQVEKKIFELAGLEYKTIPERY
jgi:DNA polymerase/3'-5' exonuclease PolX